MAANRVEGGWINPTPIEIERTLVPNKYGGFDSAPTSEGQAANYDHLRKFRQELAAEHLGRVAAEVAIVLGDSDTYGIAAD